MDIVSIIVTVVITVIMFAVSFYLYTIYCHPQDKGIGTSIGAKAIIIICQVLAWGQLLLIPLDISNQLGSQSSTNSVQIVYSIIYIIIFIFIAWIVPFTIFLYESDQQDSLKSRICWSVLFAFGIAIVWCALIFISYIWLSKYTNNAGQQVRLPLPMYIMVCLALVGWIFLCINGSIGLLFLPYQLIRDFFYRPKEITKQQAYQKKDQIENKSTELIEMGERLLATQKQFATQKLNWFAKRKKQSDIKNQLEFFKKQISKLENSFSSFDEEIGGIKTVTNEKQMQKKIQSKKTSPIVYCLYLFFGIISALISLFWTIQIFGTTLRVNQQPLFSFIDPLLVTLSEGSISFLGTGIYALMVLYLQGCAVKGNVIFGLRIPFILNFHPMKKDRTFLNSFLFNVSMMMLCSIATTELTIIAFPQYLSNSFLGQLFSSAILKLPMFGWLFSNRIFMDAFCILQIITFIFMIVKIVRLCLQNKKKGKESKIKE